MKTILIVDDDPQLRTMVKSGLSRNGYRVMEANSGNTGLQMARQYLPDLIISDIHMPGGDGATLLRDIRRDPELRSKQVVLMTGRPDLITPRKGMEDGADDFLVKPVGLKALLSCVEARFSRASISWRVEDQMVAQLRSLVPSQLPHEFFTPMAGIIGLMEILRSDFPDLPVEEVKDIHNDVYQSALRLQRTLRNYLLLLDLQAPPSDSILPLSSTEVGGSIQAGVEEALRMNKRQEDVSVTVNNCSISIRAGDLSRIVEELLDNAFKFSRHGTAVKVELTADGRLVVSDKGRGMGPEAITQIGAFQQFDRKKHEQQGLGLGLVLVQRLTALCGAKFIITSQPGEGTQVEIAFPSGDLAVIEQDESS
jgi:two-component system, sensor histidine kinase and response regulator